MPVGDTISFVGVVRVEIIVICTVIVLLSGRIMSLASPRLSSVVDVDGHRKRPVSIKLARTLLNIYNYSHTLRLGLRCHHTGDGRVQKRSKISAIC